MMIREIMTADVAVAAPGDTIQKAARMMDDLNVGSLPVCDGEKLRGVITDRDITVRATSAGKRPDECRVEEVMTAEVDYCFEDDPVETAAERMQARQIRRLPVVNRDKRLVGIVALGDMATSGGRSQPAAETLRQVSEPSEPDRTNADAGPVARQAAGARKEELDAKLRGVAGTGGKV